MKFVSLGILAVLQLILLNSAFAFHVTTQEERNQQTREFVLEAIQNDESFSELANRVDRIVIGKSRTQTGTRPGCGAAWMGSCPKNIKETFKVTTRKYIAYGAGFTCEVLGVWQHAPLQGTVLAAQEVNCYSK